MALGLIASYTAVVTFAAAMLYSAVRDVLTMTVSDRVMIMLVVAFPVLAPLAGWTLESMLYALAAAMVAFFACVALFALGWIGGGDGKMITTAVLWVGAENSFGFIMMTALIGGLYALATVGVRLLHWPAIWRRAALSSHMDASAGGIPYAVAIGGAALILIPDTLWVKDLL